jgi:hypothetical protein
MKLPIKLGLSSQESDVVRVRPSLYLSADRGVYQDAAVQFVAADKSWLACVSNATLKPTSHFVLCGWVWCDQAGSTQTIVAKGAIATTATTEYSIYRESTNKISAVIGNGSAIKIISTAATVSNGAWHFIATWYDDTAKTWNLKIDAETTVSAEWTGGLHAGASPLAVGGFIAGGTLHYPFSGRVDSLMWFTPSSAAVIADIIAWAYNSGAGRLCAEITSEQKTAWGAVSGWEFAEASGTRADSWGTNHLTEQLGEGVTEIARAPGIVRAIAANGDGVSYWQDQSAGGKHAAQITLAKRPTMVTNGINSRPVIRGDGVDDYLGVSELSLEGAFAISAVFQCAAEPSAITLLGKDANNYITLTDNTTVTVGIAGASQAFTVSAMGTDPHILTVTRDADNAVNVYLDGTVSTTGAKTVAGTLALEQIMAHGSEYFAGDLAEVLVYDGARSVNELAYTHQLLADRYGITI